MQKAGKKKLAARDYRVTPQGAVVATGTSCCTEFLPYQKCTKRFDLSDGQTFVQRRVRENNKARLLVDHEVGSGKTELALRLCNDQLKAGKNVIVAVPDVANIFTWFKELFTNKRTSEPNPIYKNCKFHAYNYSNSYDAKLKTRHIPPMFLSAYKKHEASHKQVKNMIYIDTHDFVFRGLCGLNDSSENGMTNAYVETRTER